MARVALVYLNDDRITARGPGYVAAEVIRAGHALDFYDTAYRTDEIELASLVANHDFIMLSATTLLFPGAVRLAELVRRMTDAPILLGGIHPTLFPRDALAAMPSNSFVCVGEGEGLAPDFIRRWSSNGFLADLPGIVYRNDDGGIVVNGVSPEANLADLPEFPYGLFHPASIVQDAPLPGFCYVTATRGCPFRCSYCCNSLMLDLYGKDYLRTRPADSVIDELKLLRDRYGAKVLFFGDEMVLFDRDYCDELFSKIKSEVGISYGCMARVECIDRRMVDLMRRTGCRYVGMGIECGDEQFRREFLNRRMTNAQIIEAFNLLRDVPGIVLASYNMMRYPVPYDARLSEATAAINREVMPDIVQVSTFYPFPGTKLHRYCVDHDLIDPKKLNTVKDVFAESVLRKVVE